MHPQADSPAAPRFAPFKEWSPSIHYAQFQRMPTGKLPKRRLYDFELLYVCQGKAATHMRDFSYELDAGQLIVLPSGVFHQNEILSLPDARFLGIHFDFFDELDIQTEADMVVNEANLPPRKFIPEAAAEGLPLLSANPVITPSPACVQLMEQLVHEFTMRPPGYELACKGLMLQILLHLMRTAMSSSLVQGSQHQRKLFELTAEIERHPANNWGNGEIARRMNLSLDHTAKLFKQAAGMPPSEFVQSIRHREARRLLRESDYSIERVGETVGYPDIHYFSRLFRRLEGISPNQYRKLSRIL